MQTIKATQGFCSKKVIILVLFLIPVLAAGIFFFRFIPKLEREFRANLTDAQKILVTLRRAETETALRAGGVS